MRVEVDTITAPSAWASALVNGDTSGLDDEDEKAMNAWESRLAARGWRVVDVARTRVEDGEYEMQEPRFTWSYAQYGGTARGGDVVDYVIHKIPKNKAAKGVHRIGARAPKNATAGAGRGRPVGHRCRDCGTVFRKRPGSCIVCAKRGAKGGRR